jgi:hypothetical protein
MAATISVKECNGAGGTPTTKTAIRFCTSDNNNPGTTYPLVKPTSGTNRSYEKFLYLNADTAPTTAINNVKFYTDGTIGWTGCTMYAGTTASYVQPTGTEGTTGTDSSIATVSAATYTSAAPLSVAGSIGATTGKISDYVVLQVDVSTSATAGALASETLTWQYDES